MENCKTVIHDFLPDDITLPFFSYGIFRPGEISYTLLEDLVDENKIQKIKIKGDLKVRDGLLVFENNTKGIVSGYLLYFIEGKELDAYKRIEKIEPKEYYTWNSSNAPHKKDFNILFARTVDSGIDETKSEFNPTLFELLFSSIWNDPFFNKGFKILHELNSDSFFESNLSSKEYEGWDEESNFNKYLKLQMVYTFLWSLIERFTFLSYGLGMNPSERNLALANDPDLKKSLSILIDNPNFKYFNSGFSRTISRSDRPGKKIKWEIKKDSEIDLIKMINFYYGLRSNITHRGKTGMRKSELLESSLKELLFLIENLWHIKKDHAEKTKKRIDELIVIKE
jgi:hypothetical protein